MNKEIVEVLGFLASEKPPEIRNFRICAAVVHKHREIIAIGHPRRKTHPKQKEFGKNKDAVYLHAEVGAILRALKTSYTISERDTSLYVVRLKKENPNDSTFVYGDAEPCLGCTSFMNNCGISKVHFTTG